MKFLVPILYFSFIKLVISVCLTPNVRTVLWRSSDLHRRCWSDRDIAVLYARRLFQLILPTRIVSNVPQLTAHFKMCLKVVQDMATTKETHAMMMRAMTDVIGGYLQAFGLPIAIEEYYEGNLTYSATKRVDDLLNAIKKALSTDGGRWTQPIFVQTSDQILPYEVIPANPLDNHCSDLISSADLRFKCKNQKELDWFTAKVPLPFFDNSQSPKAIAVPFRTKTLYSLFEKTSKTVLLRYYTAASHCYSAQGAAEGQITPEQLEFDRSFHKWLVKEVVPLLHDGTWYPAFGSVYRLLATMSNQGLEFPLHQDRGLSGVQARCLAKIPSDSDRSPWFFVACILGFLVMFWVVVWVVLRLRRKQSVLRKSSKVVKEVSFKNTHDVWDDHEAEDWEHQHPESFDALAAENWDLHGTKHWDDENFKNVDPEASVISYSDECDTPHSDLLLEAIIESLLGVSSSSESSPTNQISHLKPFSTKSHRSEREENSLLSTTVLSQEPNHKRPPRPGTYSLSTAAVITRNPGPKQPESV